MSGRAEHRLILRQDNADLCLTEIGRKISLVSDKRYGIFLAKEKEIMGNKITDGSYSPKKFSV